MLPELARFWLLCYQILMIEQLGRRRSLLLNRRNAADARRGDYAHLKVYLNIAAAR